MRSPARFWLTLTQWALLAGCSGHLPLDINGSAPDHDKLPVELAGSGAGMRGAAGAGVAGASRTTPGRADAGPPKNPPVCGDGQIQAPEEACDRANLNGASCQSLGYSAGGTLLCNPSTCTYDTIMCRMTVFVDAGVGRPTPGDTDAGSEDAG